MHNEVREREIEGEKGGREKRGRRRKRRKREREGAGGNVPTSQVARCGPEREIISNHCCRLTST